ncbi:MAG: YgjV family protein [Oscillospiraceae bacterium]|nr:YgjV family protein [Oscillospiraceae bacterium]
MWFYIAQGVGLIGMALVFIAFQQNDKRKILWINAVAGLVFALHFIFLRAYTGMGMNLMEIPRNLIFARITDKRRQRIWTAGFIVAILTLGLITCGKNLFLFLPAIAMSIATVVFSLQNPRYIRFFSLPVSVFWMTYNIIVFSVAGILTESFCFTSIIIAIIRFDILKKPTENQ